MNLREIYFVDRERLAQYFEQISSTKDRFVPTVSVGIHGPSVNVSRQREEPRATVLAQLDALCSYLRDRNLLGEHRPMELDRWDLGDPHPGLPDATNDELRRPFRLEVCEATPVLVPPNKGAAWILDDGLHLWYSERSTYSFSLHPLILIEAFPLADGPARWLEWNSGFTLLSVVNDTINGTPPRDWGWGETTVSYGHLRFPSLMKKLGAHRGSPRMVQVLYRVRVTYFDRVLNHTVVVGYPIAIERA